ncbi:Thioredoxin-like protein, partial [Globisporangium splendens]
MAIPTRNVKGITLLDQLPDLPFSASDGTHSSLHAYFKGSWGLLFSHPDDFTPICTTELGEVARLDNAGVFKERNTKLLGLSCNNVESHKQWIADIEEFAKEKVNYPIIADEKRVIAAELGMLSQDDLDKEGLPLTVRTLFVLDPEVKVRLTITYPASTGRNFVEIVRVLDSLQLSSAHKVATPANWKKGEPVCVAANISVDEATSLFPDVDVKPLPSGKEYLRFTNGLN